MAARKLTPDERLTLVAMVVALTTNGLKPHSMSLIGQGATLFFGDPWMAIGWAVRGSCCLLPVCVVSASCTLGLAMQPERNTRTGVRVAAYSTFAIIVFHGAWWGMQSI